jgi:hypothetical protein
LRLARQARNAIGHDQASFTIHHQPGRTIREAMDGRLSDDFDDSAGRSTGCTFTFGSWPAPTNLVSTWCFDIEEGRKASRSHQRIEVYRTWWATPVNSTVE